MSPLAWRERGPFAFTPELVAGRAACLDKLGMKGGWAGATFSFTPSLSRGGRRLSDLVNAAYGLTPEPT